MSKRKTTLSPSRLLAGTPNYRTRIGIVIDPGFFRELVVNLFDGVKDKYRIVLQAGEDKLAEQMNKLPTNDLPEIIIIAATIPRLNTSEAVHYVRKYHKDKIKILVLSVQFDLPYITQMINRGVDAYLPHDAKRQDFFHVLDTIKSKGYFYPGSMDERILLSIQEGTNSFEKKWSYLDFTQKKILQLFSNGMDYDDIARELNLTHQQINYRKNKIRRVLNVKSDVDLIRLMVKNKMVEYLPSSMGNGNPPAGKDRTSEGDQGTGDIAPPSITSEGKLETGTPPNDGTGRTKQQRTGTLTTR